MFKINIIVYLGLALDFNKVPSDLYFLCNLSIIIPVALLIGSIYHFEHCDL